MRKQTTFKRITWDKKSVSAIIVLGILLLATCTIAFKVELISAVSPTPVLLGTASYFSILAGSGITNTGTTTITADAGTYPTTSETGFNTVTFVDGTNHAGDAVTQGAKGDLLTAYNDAAGQTPITVPTELGDTTLTPGVYNSTSGTLI